MDNNTKKFLSDLILECSSKGVKLELHPGEFVEISKDIRCAGYFSGGSSKEFPCLVSSIGKDTTKWLSILVHESCHMDQWYENIPLWEDVGVELIDKWLAGKRVGKNRLEKAFYNAQELELDCEKRSVAKIKKYKLPIDTTVYIQKSNAYLYFYSYLKKVRKWSYPEKSPYSDKIHPFMPKKFLKDYSILPLYIEELFDKNLNLL